MKLTARLVLRVVLPGMIILGSSIPLLADSILYTFSGSNNLSGSFTLDDAAPFTITSMFKGDSLLAVLTSPNQMISGTYEGYTFSGTAGLYVVRQPVWHFNGNGVDCVKYTWECTQLEAVGPDYWYIRASISSPELNGLSLTALNLFVSNKTPGSDCLGPNTPSDYGPCTTDGLLTPPQYDPLYDPSAPSFNMSFSNGPYQSGSLTSLTRVPEPTTLVLLSIGLVAVGFLRPKRGTKGLWM